MIMKSIRLVPLAVVTAFVLSAPFPAYAADGMGTMDTKSPMPNAAPFTDGEVKKVDKEGGKITIKHGPLINLGMPGMTMMFPVADPTLLDRVKEGDKIKFRAENVGGTLTVTKIDVVR
jgi:Cu(I)/Ag(I) efflux system protein CusF